jgi:hypothetical protein
MPGRRRLLLELSVAIGAAALGGVGGWIAYVLTLPTAITPLTHCPGPPPTDFSRPIPSCAGPVSLAPGNGNPATEALYVLGGIAIALLILTAIWLWNTRIRSTRSRGHLDPGRD